MVGRAVVELAFLGLGVFLILASAGLAEWTQTEKKLTRQETRQVRLGVVFVGTFFCVFALVDVVMAVLGKSWVFG